jgi:hypothetical protein
MKFRSLFDRRTLDCCFGGSLRNLNDGLTYVDFMCPRKQKVLGAHEPANRDVVARLKIRRCFNVCGNSLGENRRPTKSRRCLDMRR